MVETLKPFEHFRGLIVFFILLMTLLAVLLALIFPYYTSPSDVGSNIGRWRSFIILLPLCVIFGVLLSAVLHRIIRVYSTSAPMEEIPANNKSFTKIIDRLIIRVIIYFFILTGLLLICGKPTYYRSVIFGKVPGLQSSQHDFVRIWTISEFHRLETECVESEILRVLQQDPDPTVRNYAAVILGVKKVKKSTNVLMNVLKCDNDFGVRSSAAWALGKLKDEKAISALEEASRKDKNASVRRAASRALSEILP